MTPLVPLGGNGKRARPPSTSALAAFAHNKPLDGSAMPSSTAAGGPGAAFKPLKSSVRTLDDGLVGVVGGALTPVAKPPAEMSALAAFAKKSVLLPSASAAAHSSLDKLRSGSMAKRPAPLALASLGASSQTQNDRQDKKNGECSVANRGEEKKEVDLSEPKAEEARADSASKTSGTAADDATMEKAIHQGEKADSRSNGSSSDDDSMAEFACMEPDDEDGEPEEKEAMDVDDLYDHGGDEHESKAVLKAKERIFVPPTSKHDLFHAILVKDVDLLTHILRHMAPHDVLGVRDTEERTMYHYAALSRSPEIQAVVFDFISCFLTQESDRQIASIASKQRRLGKWKGDQRSSPNKSDWIPPSVQEIQSSSAQELTSAYLAGLHAYDHNGRSFLHYSALNHHVSPVQVSRGLAKILKSHRVELLRKDVFARDPLMYAVMADNTQAVTLWFSHLGFGESLTVGDIDRLTQLRMSHSTQRVLFKLLEDCDSAPRSRKDATKPSNGGLSMQFLTKCPIQSGALSTGSAPSGTRMWTSLHKAVVYGNVDAVRQFIDRGASIHERDSDGWTPLHATQVHSSIAHLEIAELLLASGADVNATSLHGRSPLHLVAMQPPEQVEQFSIAAMVDDSSNASQCVEFATLLCDRSAKLEVSDEDHYTPFLAAVRAGNVRLARFLLEANCDPSTVDKTGGCALHIAVNHGLDEMVRFLGWWDAQCPMWRFAKDYHGRLPKALTRGDGTIRGGLDNLWYSVRRGDVNEVRHELQQYRSLSKRERARHVSVHDKTPLTKRTALHLAIEPYLESIQHDTKRRAAPKSMNHSRSSQETKQIVLALLEEGASVAIGDKWGISPLMLAASIDSPLIMNAMLKFATKEDLKQTDSGGSTAVHYSYAFSRAKSSSLLEDAMDDAESENSDGRAPLAVTGYRDKIFPREYWDSFNMQRSKPPPTRASATPVRK